jgi:hypothetical protein
MMMSSMLVCFEANPFLTEFYFYLSHPAMKPWILSKFIYNFPMMIIVPILLQVLRKISSKLTMLFFYVILIPCFTLFQAKLSESQAEIELLLILISGIM